MFPISGEGSMFTGKYQNSIDSKFRMIIPSKYREELGYKCVITKGIDKCLNIHPQAQWDAFLEKLKELPQANMEVRSFIRILNQSAVTCEADKQGRITLPQEHREYAGITKDLITIGVMDKIEVWSKENWEADSATQMDPADLAKAMEAYGI